MTHFWTMDTVRERCDEIGECLVWRGGVDSWGYPAAHIEGQKQPIRTYIFTRLMGRERSPGCRLTTKCGNRRCLSDQCIVQASNKAIAGKAMANYAKNPLHRRILREGARKAGFVKKTEEIAAEIRSSGQSIEELMARHNLSRSTVQRILRGDIWKPMPSSIFNLGG